MKTEPMLMHCLTAFLAITCCRSRAEQVVSRSFEEEHELFPEAIKFRTFRQRLPITERQHSMRRNLMPLGTLTVNATLNTEAPEVPTDDILVETNTSTVDGKEDGKIDDASELDIPVNETPLDTSMSADMSMNMNYTSGSQESRKSSKNSKKSGDDGGTQSPSTTYQPTSSPSTTSSPSIT